MTRRADDIGKAAIYKKNIFLKIVIDNNILQVEGQLFNSPLHTLFPCSCLEPWLSREAHGPGEQPRGKDHCSRKVSRSCSWLSGESSDFEGQVLGREEGISSKSQKSTQCRRTGEFHLWVLLYVQDTGHSEEDERSRALQGTRRWGERWRRKTAQMDLS